MFLYRELTCCCTCTDVIKWFLQGYFQLLYSCIEKLLAFLNVKSFILPATDEAKSIWTEKFGFNKIPDEKVCNRITPDLFRHVYC